MFVLFIDLASTGKDGLVLEINDYRFKYVTMLDTIVLNLLHILYEKRCHWLSFFFF